MAQVDIYEAARRTLQVGLAEDGSLFTPGQSVWTAAAADELVERFVDSPDVSSDSFLVKLRGQLHQATPAAIQLAGELMYFHLLAPVDIGGPAKRDLVDGVLGIATEPVPLPADLAAVLDGGFARVGTAYFTMRDRQLSFLIRFVQAWKRLPLSDREIAMTDPWRFRDAVDAIPVNSAFGQRFALLHFAFPSTFQPIVSRAHRKAIIEAFSSELGPSASGDDDRDLLDIKNAVAESSGTGDFYEEPLVSRWQKGSDPAQGKSRGWLVRGGNVVGRDLVPEWLRGGYCSLSYHELPELPAGASLAQLRSLVGEARPDWNANQRGIHVGILHRFLTEMKEGDLVVTVSGPYLYAGTVAGPAVWVPEVDEHSRRRRRVDWWPAENRLPRDRLSDAARNKLQGQMTVSDLGPTAAEIVAQLPEPVTPVVPLPEIEPVFVDETALIPSATAELAQRSLMPIDWLDDTLQLLRDKRQLVLYGPPGTGKTYLAQELALHITEQTGGSYRLVQFHPSYSYEDFFEGFRPRPGDGGTILFSLEPGPLKLLAEEAASEPQSSFVLVIDEVNRANLAKVFGELYFLLEYRDRAVNLQYSPGDEFRLPPNLFVIGTMNTADRSIALVDAAMRRRFSWQGLFPGEPPVDRMLRKWLTDHGLPIDTADLLDRLNERIGDRDGAVGPSYLMHASVADPDGLERIWRHQILPLLEERHAGDGTDVESAYGLESLRSGVAIPAEPVAQDNAWPEEDGEPLT